MTKIYYENGSTKVTSTQFVHGKTTIPLNLIARTTAFSSSFDFGTFFVNVIGVFLGLYFVSLFQLAAFVIGLVILGICGFNLKNLLSVREHHLSIDLHNGGDYRLTVNNRTVIDEIDSALQLARTEG